MSVPPPELPSWLRFLPGDRELYETLGAEGLRKHGLQPYLALLGKEVLDGLQLMRDHYVATGRLPAPIGLGAMLRGALRGILLRGGLPTPTGGDAEGLCTVLLPKEVLERAEALRQHYISIGRVPPQTDLGTTICGMLQVLLEERGYPLAKKARMRLV
jgi:hypothetical protein